MKINIKKTEFKSLGTRIIIDGYELNGDEIILFTEKKTVKSKLSNFIKKEKARINRILKRLNKLEELNENKTPIHRKIRKLPNSSK